LLESREVPIALAGDCPELFENNTLCGRYFSGEDCFDSVFDTSIRPKHGYTVFRVPQKYNFSLMPSNNQVFEIDHHTPLAEAQGTGLKQLCQTHPPVAHIVTSARRWTFQTCGPAAPGRM